jgi:hypothetical protein
MTVAKISNLRHVALVMIRAAGAILIVYGGGHVIWGIGSYVGLLGWHFVEGLSSFWDEMFNPFWFGLGALLPGICLAVFSRQIARWLVPLPQYECPQCGYALQQLTTTRCPECGLELGPPPSPAATNDTSH